MNITDFKAMVASFMNRDLSLFTSGSVDILLSCINTAKAAAQREEVFEYAKCSAQIVLTAVNASADLSTTTLLDGSTPVAVNKIQKAFLVDPTTGKFFPIDFISRDAQIYALQRKIEDVDPRNRQYLFDPSTVSYNKLVQQGTSVFLDFWDPAWTAPKTIGLDIVRWMPEYGDGTGGTVTMDFFLTYCRDWLLYRSILELNFFLKDDQRVMISDKVYEKAWESVRSWNSAIVSTYATDAELR